MKRLTWALPAVALGALTLQGCANKSMAADNANKTERGAIDVTVYNEDFAMVHEQRPVSLTQGKNKLRIGDVSKQLDPSSVLFTWPNPSAAQVVSNTYDLGVEGGGSLLKRYVGQEVEMVWYGQDGREGQRAKGTLQVAGDGGIVLKSDGKFLVNPTGTVIAPSRPDVVTIPQLSVDVESASKQQTRLDVAYLTRGLAWSADYVARLDPAKAEMNLECWATVTNQTGTTFPEAKITLVAGAPNRAVASPAPEMEFGQILKRERFDFNNSLPKKKVVWSFSQGPQAVGELYAYPIKSPATIAPNQMNRVKMLSSERVPIEKDYSVRLPSDDGWSEGGSAHHQNAQLAINFANVEKSGLGVPLPKGAARVYEHDSSGSVRYVGAADIRDTAKGGRISLTLSNVFDVTSEYKMVKSQRLDKKHVRRDIEVVLANAKKTPVRLRLVQDLYGAKISSESIKSAKLNAHTSQWIVPIPAEGHVKLSYSIVGR